MTEKQKIFCDEYLIDLNATRAYKAAYPKAKKDSAARTNGSKLLTNTNIKNYIDERLKEMHSKRTADAKEVLEYLTAVLRGETVSEIVVVEGCGEGYSEARRMNKNPDEKERLKAAELLGKYYALFTDKSQVEQSGVVQIINDIPRSDK